jgi:hypothetical protein
MADDIDITIVNRLVLEERDMNIYHYSTRSAHMISYNSSITLPLKSTLEEDYLHISIVSGPGNLENNSVVNLPSWADFEFSTRGDVTVAHSGERTLLKLPAGFPMWQLRMTRSLSSHIEKKADHVIIGEDQMEAYP